ncbi:MAG: excinuclease ABC subunit UvrC [Bacteroides sp.]|nr:excinuclease ABC subunit UvrC [Bacillota bacterium]MCM1394130.1 excinuclease ABC subunit UvrC [[Eubacterium] siraeum]MCM1456052.1 excinuclease ABC subunit UvrC [Bacteroides sp.]
MVDFKAKLHDVPTNPGVYMMLDEKGEIIYVGKAKNLKNRLRSYFFNLSNRTAKVMAMLEHVADFRYIICASEVDALLTENNLIKKHTPRYNILLKDDKAYPFLRIDMKQPYPKIDVVRKLKNDGAKYFGPYMQSINVRDITELIHTAFQVRDCNRDLGKPSRPCLNKHLGRCLAPCAGEVSQDEYRLEMQKVIDFLRGNDREVERVLNEKMLKFAQEENFEVALNYRNKLRVLNKIVQKQVSALPKDFNLDIFAFESNGIISAVNMLVVRAGKLVGGENFTASGADEDIASYIYQYYVNNPPLCDEIVTDCVEDTESLESAINKLSAHTVRVVEPKQGVRKQLLDLAHSNAYDAMEKHGTQDERKELRTVGAVKQLSELLGLKTLPNRIEGYDISHISGTDKVASMVVFEGGQPKKAHYRKFKIKTVEGNNDFACMREVLTRRLERLHGDDESFSTIPDLLLIDGGKGQLAYAKEAQAITGREDIEIISLAKREEEVFLGSNPTTPVILPKDSFALQLLQRVRDESHRFAITFHRNLRSKHLSESALKNIKGIGPKTASALIRAFGSVEDIKRKTPAELAEAEGISLNKAQYILDELNAAEKPSATDNGEI